MPWSGAESQREKDEASRYQCASPDPPGWQRDLSQEQPGAECRQEQPPWGWGTEFSAACRDMQLSMRDCCLTRWFLAHFPFVITRGVRLLVLTGKLDGHFLVGRRPAVDRDRLASLQQPAVRERRGHLHGRAESADNQPKNQENNEFLSTGGPCHHAVLSHFLTVLSSCVILQNSRIFWFRRFYFENVSCLPSLQRKP